MNKILVLTISLLLNCSIVKAVPLPTLFSGGSYQLEGFTLTNWELVNAVNVNLINIDIDYGYNFNPTEIGLWSRNHELRVEAYQSKILSFDFFLQESGANLDQVSSNLGYRSIFGYNYGSPQITGAISIGTTKGANDLGTSIDIYNFYQDTPSTFLDVPSELEGIWVRNTISLFGGSGWAELGYIGQEGPGFRDTFVPEPVPEPATIFLLGSGVAGLAGFGWRKKRA